MADKKNLIYLSKSATRKKGYKTVYGVCSKVLYVLPLFFRYYNLSDKIRYACKSY